MARVIDETDPLHQLVNEWKPQRVARWAGWFRARGRWRKVAEAQTERECWERLFNYRDPRSLTCERCVLKAGVTPPPVRSRDE